MKNDTKNVDTVGLLLKQPYAVTMARHRLNVYEMRIMFRVIEALQPRMVYDKSPYQISQTNIGDTTITMPTRCLLVPGDENYKLVRDALDSLTKKHIHIAIKDDKGVSKEVFTNLIKEAIYEHRSSSIRIDISRNLMPQILGLSRNYTKYLLSVAFNSSSPNVMKLYQYVAQWRDKKQTFLRVTSLRQWLLLGEKYRYPSQIKKWILEPASKELKASADVWFDIASRVKEGRRTMGWTLNIYTKERPEVKRVAPLPLFQRQHPPIPQEQQKDPARQQVWSTFVNALKGSLSEENYKTWVTPMAYVSHTEEELVVGVPSKSFYQYIEEYFLTELQQAVKAAIGNKGRLHYNVARGAQAPTTKESLQQKLVQEYGLLKKQAAKVDRQLRHADNLTQQSFWKQLKAIKTAARDGKIRTSIGGYTVGILQKLLDSKL